VVNLSEKTLLIRKIENGTVIDHIVSGYALDVLRILGIKGREGNVISIAMNVSSKRLGKKDIVKIEGRELRPEEVDRIALIAPQATINIIRDFMVVEKERVNLPTSIRSIVTCANPTCISNSNEPVKPLLDVIQRDPLIFRCHYCGTMMEKEDVLKQF